MGLVLLGFIGFILLYLGCAWGLSRIPVRAESNASPDMTIYLYSNGVHMDVVVPVKTATIDWSQQILFSNTRGGDTTFDYIAFGWGDRGFYLETPTWADLKVSTAFKAAFGLSRTAIHATFYHQMHEGSDCIPLEISTGQYERLVQFIEGSLQHSDTGAPIVIPTEARYGKSDAFYEAKGRYSLFHTCNTWTNNALKASGQKACFWTPFDKGIFYQYRK